MSLERKNAFTLIEMLVVVTIILLLGAILFPVFTLAREDGRRAACQSDAKQIGFALVQYCQDYDAHTPPQPPPPGSPTSTCTAAVDFADPTAPGWFTNWIYELNPYARNWQIFVCPSVTVPDTGGPPSASYPDSLSTWMVNAVVTARSIAVIPDSSSVVWAQEKDTLGSEAVVRPCLYDNGTPPSPYVAGKTYQDWLRPPWSNVHFAGGNLLYCDGHVKWKAQTSICAGDFGLIDSTVNKTVIIDQTLKGVDCGSSPDSGQSIATAAF